MSIHCVAYAAPIIEQYDKSRTFLQKWSPTEQSAGDYCFTIVSLIEKNTGILSFPYYDPIAYHRIASIKSYAR